ncbi:MAG: rod shape-determining protein MreD [Bacteroidia bacterium]|nr:rod shape-determining protein MreD [Bacteroidia bacterium]
MIITYIHKVLWLIGLVLLQVLILNNIHIAGYATPFLYIYLILKIETSISRNELMIWGFALGLLVDIFSNTPGMNAAATVLVAFLRPLLLRLFTPRDTFDAITPSFRSMGNTPFLKYLVSAIFIHTLVLLAIESFSFPSMTLLLLRVVLCTLLTFVCVIAVESIRK